jgi:hypothetical protein
MMVVVVALVGACGALAPAPSLASNETSRLQGGGSSFVVDGQAQEGVVVVGTGMASADPELAQVSFGVELQGEDADTLVSEAAQKMEAAMAAAREFGILEEKTRTMNYNLWVETVHDPNTGRPTGQITYHLSHQVQVTTDKIDTVGELLAGIVGAGANAVSGVNFTVEDTAALVEQAREAAIADAQARGEHIADQLGIALGKPVAVIEGGGSGPVFAADRGMGGGMAEAASAPGMTPGSFSVTVSMRIVYAIR